MADENKSGEGFVDPSKNNEEVANKLKEQGIEKPVTPEDLSNSGSALDALVEAKKKEKEATPDPEKKETPPAKTEAELAAEKKAQDEAAAKAAETEAHKKRADEIFKDTPGLPAGASPKSSEAFATIKVKAAQEITARDAEIDKLKKRNEELENAAKQSKPLTPEIEKEVEELRKFRARVDLEADPKFKEFDKTAQSAREFIYSQLRKSPAITDEVIEEIKKHGGPDNVKMEKIFEAIKDPTIQRLVESKIADIEMAKHNKQEAIARSKEDISKYLEEREKSAGEAAQAHNKATQEIFQQFRTSEGLQWLKPKVADPKADEATKKAIDEHNEFVKTTEAQIASAYADDSPTMRAILLAGMAQLLHVQRLNAANTAKLSTIEADHKKVVDGHLATIKELQAKLDKIKGASISRLEQSGAVNGGKTPEVKAGDLDTRPTTQALDDIARDIREKRNAA